MEDNSKQNYSQQSNDSQNEQEKHIETARLNVDSERKMKNLKDDTDPNRYYNNTKEKEKESDAASTSGKESSYSSPEDERAYDPKNPPEKYIAEENPDAKEESDSNGVKIPDRTPGL